jgi:hypothetical protein
MVLKTAKGAANLQEITPVVLTPAETTEQTRSMESMMESQDNYTRLQAEAKRINAELKAAKAEKQAAKAAKVAKVALTELEKIVAKQATTPVWLPSNLAARVQARVQVGQDQAEAFEEMFAWLRTATQAELDCTATSESAE